MTLENQVCSLELAKKLKELKVKQKSYFWWRSIDHAEFRDWDLSDCQRAHGSENISAYTVAELGELLPFFINKNKVWVGQLMCVRHPNYWTISYGTINEAYISKTSGTEADARAKMLIYLIENKLI